jgi:hypothetical protein
MGQGKSFRKVHFVEKINPLFPLALGGQELGSGCVRFRRNGLQRAEYNCFLELVFSRNVCLLRKFSNGDYKLLFSIFSRRISV